MLSLLPDGDGRVRIDDGARLLNLTGWRGDGGCLHHSPEELASSQQLKLPHSLGQDYSRLGQDRNVMVYLGQAEQSSREQMECLAVGAHFPFLLESRLPRKGSRADTSATMLRPIRSVGIW